MVILDFLTVILILSMGQSLFLAVTVLTNKVRTKPANLLLALLLIAFLWYQLEFFLIRNKLDASFPFIYSTRYGSWLLVGPLVYLYNKASIIKEFEFHSKHLLHFIPFAILVIVVPLFSDGLLTWRSVDYGMLTVFDNWNRDPITFKQYLYGSVFGLQFVHALVYLFFAYRETTNLSGLAMDQYSSINEKTFSTQQYILLGGTIIIMLCSSFITFQFITTIYRRNADYFYVLPMMIMVYGLIYRAIKFPNSVISFSDFPLKKKYEKSSLAPQAADAYLEMLERKIQDEKVYRNNELRLMDLAQELDITTHHLSQVINEKLNKNFFDYINSFRVDEAKELIKTEEQKNLLEIAYSVGFNNKNSFNNAFKKHTGMNPSNYRKEAMTG